jgi:prolyl-tRNA synthetase
MSCFSIEESHESIELNRVFGELSLKPKFYGHPAAFTVEEQAEHLSSLPGVLTKNLFLRDKKHGYFLLTAAADRNVDMKVVGKLLGLAGANLRFGDEDTLGQVLGVKRGSVSPLACINDTENKVVFVLDSSLLDADLINVHPLRNDQTMSFAPPELTSFAEKIGHAPKIIDFSKATVATVPAAKGGNKQTKAVAKPAKAMKDKGETMLSLSVTKEEDFSRWYTEVITLSEMIDYSDISGCYVLRPWAFFLWEQIQQWFDAEIKKLGVKNSYFPLFVSKRALETEKDHVEGFAPEVAWVTKSGESDLAEPIAVRPTSETVMYPFYAKWIRSHRDLPLELNQWCNVVRWEFKDATPFLRSREFLWQEGHTAHVSYEEAQKRVLSILDLYALVYEHLLAVPVIKGIKTEAEKFAGGEHTTTVEAYINGSGRAIQGATSHNLGQNFGKMFKMRYEDDKGESAIPWQTSWGLTTRTIGVCVMVHGDNKGLVLPPRVAPTQVVICPIISKAVSKDTMLDFVYGIKKGLEAQEPPVRVEVDARENYTPGWKYNHWEQKGVPIRLEVGPRDIEKNQCRLVRRDTSEKEDVAVDGATERVVALLDVIQNDMFTKAKAKRDEKLARVFNWADFVPALNQECMVLTPFCDETEWEDKVKAMSRDEALNGATEEATCATSVAAKTLCKPFDAPDLPEGTPCFVSGKPAKAWVLWGRSY